MSLIERVRAWVHRDCDGLIIAQHDVVVPLEQEAVT
jgi:hypothetical protein